jgi:hypothetical protein
MLRSSNFQGFIPALHWTCIVISSGFKRVAFFADKQWCSTLLLSNICRHTGTSCYYCQSVAVISVSQSVNLLLFAKETTLTAVSKVRRFFVGFSPLSLWFNRSLDFRLSLVTDTSSPRTLVSPVRRYAAIAPYSPIYHP